MARAEAKTFNVDGWVSQMSKRRGRVGEIVRAAAEDTAARDRASARDALADIVGPFYEAQYNEVNRKRLPDDAFSGRFIDDLNGKEELLRLASTYVQTPWLHCRTFCLTVLLTVVDTELYPLRREMNDPAARNEIMAKYGMKGFVNSMTDSTTSVGWRVFWQIMGGLYTLALAAALLIAIASLSLVWSIIFAAWLGVRIYRKITASRFEAKLTVLLRSLQTIRDELASGSFSAVRIGERLRALEAQGTRIPSVAYDLLTIYERLPADEQIAAPSALAPAARSPR